MKDKTVRYTLDIINVNKVNWRRISKYHTLSEHFIREFQDKVNWNCISKYQKLSKDFENKFNL